MQNKKVLTTVLSIALGVSAFAQSPVQFSLNGLGRSYNTYNNLSGNITNGDTKTHKAGLGGYDLFDLQTNLSTDSTFTATAVFRTKTDFGAFFGSSTAFKFRMFNVGGKLKDFKYELGDVRIEMTPFTVYNFGDMYNKFESEIFQNRRNIAEYENLNKGNSWLVQGAHVQYGHKFENIAVGAYGFVSRLVPTNDFSTSDRLLSGARVGLGFSDKLKFGGNYVGLFDNAINTAAYAYSNHVGTGEVEFVKEDDASKLKLKFEGGASMFQNRNNLKDTITPIYKDYFLDLTASYLMKNQGVSFEVNVTDVGPYFNSPSAQTRRVLDYNMPSVFPKYSNATVNRSGGLFDRITDPSMYNSQINGVLQTYLNQFNNAQPYGKATPNRRGASLMVASDTSMKNISFEIGGDYLTEIAGEGITDLRQFVVVKGGVKLELGKLLDMSRKIDISVGGRLENTTRSGNGKVALSSYLVDAGLSLEMFKKVDLLLGYKMLQASGNEFIAPRNNFNEIVNLTAVNINSNESITSAGLQVRFSTTQAFSVNYNYVSYSAAMSSNSYNISQLAMIYQGKF